MPGGGRPPWPSSHLSQPLPRGSKLTPAPLPDPRTTNSGGCCQVSSSAGGCVIGAARCRAAQPRPRLPLASQRTSLGLYTGSPCTRRAKWQMMFGMACMASACWEKGGMQGASTCDGASPPHLGCIRGGVQNIRHVQISTLAGPSCPVFLQHEQSVRLKLKKSNAHCLGVQGSACARASSFRLLPAGESPASSSTGRPRHWPRAQTGA